MLFQPRREWVWHDLQNHRPRHADDALQLFRWRGRRRSVRRTRRGRRRELLRDSVLDRGIPWRDGLQDYASRSADDALQILRTRPYALPRWQQPARGARPGDGWELLRDNVQRGGQQPRDSLQNHAERRANHALQLLLPGGNRLHGRQRSARGADPGQRREFLRDDL